ncbi:MAG: MiaB/RimO family radical SAM methylthiotransferase [bacterium]
MKAFIISLGCPKNLTDTEVLMGKLVATGYEIANSPSDADIIIINTCAFLKSAREETLATIKEMAKWRKKGKKLYIAGCYPKWNKGKKMPGVDGLVNSLGLFDACTPRIKATSPWFAYVKIAEGCNNKCSYCLIPSIRGKLKTRPVNDVLQEVRQLAERGVKEIIFIAQDTTAHPKFAEILQKTARIKKVRWIRVMYAHPAHLTDKIINVMAQEKKIVKYLDLPIQHCNDKILQSMNRHVTRSRIESLIKKIRRQIPTIALRTSVIVGYPGESDAEFSELVDFIKEVKFSRLGAFTYSREEGTPAGKLRGPALTAGRQESSGRIEKIMRAQAHISKGLNKKMIGRTLEVLIEGANFGRSYMDAPEVDGRVFIKSRKTLTPGEIRKVRITKTRTHDLYGVIT